MPVNSVQLRRFKDPHIGVPVTSGVIEHLKHEGYILPSVTALSWSNPLKTADRSTH